MRTTGRTRPVGLRAARSARGGGIAIQRRRRRRRRRGSISPRRRCRWQRRGGGRRGGADVAPAPRDLHLDLDLGLGPDLDAGWWRPPIPSASASVLAAAAFELFERRGSRVGVKRRRRPISGRNVGPRGRGGGGFGGLGSPATTTTRRTTTSSRSGGAGQRGSPALLLVVAAALVTVPTASLGSGIIAIQTGTCGKLSPCPDGSCCSKYGWCGLSSSHCDAPNCLSNCWDPQERDGPTSWGKKSASKRSASPASTSIYTAGKTLVCVGADRRSVVTFPRHRI